MLLLVLAGCSSSDDTSSAVPAGGTGGVGGGVGGVGGSVGGAGGSGGQAGVLAVRAVAAHEAVGLEWDEYDGAQSYNVYWSLQPGVTTADDSVTGVSPGFVHRGLENGTAYHYTVTAVEGASEHAVYGEASAVPEGDFVLYRLGTGVVDDVSTGGAFAIPIEQRLHTVILAEGYLDTDLAAGTFDDDVDEWHEDLFAIGPYDAYAEAFVVWSLPTASAERISASDPQQAATAFLVPIASDGDGVQDVPSTGPTADRIWAALAAFPFPPVDFYPAGGSTSQQAQNLLVHVLVLDPDTGDSGLSGRARRLENPADPTERVSVAFAKNLAHEFTHAFARLEDEYLDQAQTNNAEQNAVAVDSAHLSNVVTEPDCATVPWSHLLAGTAINPSTDELVGAFGTAQLGYHAELRCLMNGTHDNAVFYGGDGRLRASDRMCNYCREVTAFRIVERTHRLADPATSYAQWVADHRGPFYERFGFAVPTVVPQENSDGTPIFEACAP
ncbi:MAG: hypothetical protein JRI55_20755 [Deltaproteobacteria bacterium]|nr:hypothetical protein [Deltaproteobacteria bacterium]